MPPGQASQARWSCAEHIPGHAPVNSGHAVGDHAAGRDSAATHDAAYRPTRRYPDATDDAAHHGADPPSHPDETGHAAVHYNHDAACPDDPLSPVIRMQHSHVHRFPEGIPLLVVVGDADGRAIRRRRTESGDEPHRIDRECRRTESGDSGWGEGQSRWDEGGQQPVPLQPGHAPVDATLAYPALKKIRALMIWAKTVEHNAANKVGKDEFITMEGTEKLLDEHIQDFMQILGGDWPADASSRCGFNTYIHAHRHNSVRRHHSGCKQNSLSVDGSESTPQPELLVPEFPPAAILQPGLRRTAAYQAARASHPLEPASPPAAKPLPLTMPPPPAPTRQPPP